MELPGGSLMCPQTQLVLQHLPPSIPGLPTKELCPTTASTCAWVHVLVNNLYGHDLHTKLALLLIAGRIFYHKELCLEPVWLTTERKAFSSINWTTTKSIHIKGFEGLLLFFFSAKHILWTAGKTTFWFSTSYASFFSLLLCCKPTLGSCSLLFLFLLEEKEVLPRPDLFSV